MFFCSNCGLLQPPNVTICSRCGVAVTPYKEAEGQNPNDRTFISAPDKTEPSKGQNADDRTFISAPDKTEPSKGQNANDPTVISAPDKTEPAKGGDKPTPLPSQPGLGQGPTHVGGYDSQTQRVEQGENTSVPNYRQNGPFPGYYQQASVPPPSLDRMSRSDGDFSTSQAGFYPGYVPGADFPTNRDPRSPSSTPQQTNSRTAMLVMLLILFLVVITIGTTTAVFVVGPDKILQMVGGSGATSQPTDVPLTSQASTPVLSTPTPQISTPTPTPTPNQQAQSVVTHYYTAINSKDYQTAYNLWVSYPDSYQNFANGFSDTQHDDYQFGQVLPQSDGTVQVYITLVATSTSSQQTTYQGYYIVGQQSDGSWKLVKGHLGQA